MPRRRSADRSAPEYQIVQRILNEAVLARQNSGLTQIDVSNATGYSQSGISTLESYKTPQFSLVTLVRYLMALGYDDVKLVPVKRGEQ